MFVLAGTLDEAAGKPCQTRNWSRCHKQTHELSRACEEADGAVREAAPTRLAAMALSTTAKLFPGIKRAI